MAKIKQRKNTGRLILLLLVLLPASILPQPGPESGKTIKTQPLPDSAKIIGLLKQADIIAETNTDSAIAMAWQAAESSKRLHFQYGIAVALQYCGIFYSIKGNHQFSIRTLQQSLAVCGHKPKENELRIKILSILAEVYWQYGKADSTAYYCYEAINQIEKLHISKPAVLIESYTSILQLWVSLNDNPTDLANDKYMQRALNYLDKASQLKQTGPSTQGRIMFAKAQLKESLKQYDSARYYYRGYLQMINNNADVVKNRSDSWASAMLINIGQVFLLQKNADSTIWYAKAAISRLPPNGGAEFKLYIFANYQIGQAFCLQKKYREAIAVILPALAIAKQKNIGQMQETAHKTLAGAYGKTGNYLMAFEHQEAYSALKDSLMQKGKMQAISQMEMKYQVAEKDKALSEKQVAILQKDSSIRTKNFWIAGILAGVVVLLLGATVLYNRNRNRQQLQALQATINGEENERRRLARELHDGIGGQLGSLRLHLSTALRNNGVNDTNGDFDAVMQLISNTYTNLRQSAHNLLPENLLEEGLAKAAATFCDNLAQAADFELNFETVGNIPRLAPHQELALYRILQELVHNIVKHAQASEVIVQFAFAKGRLGLTVEDNGKGFDTSKEKAGGKGLGLADLQNRLKAMGGSIDIFSEPGKGTSINVELYT